MTVRKILLTAMVLFAVAAVAGAGTFSAFSSQTQNSGNSFAAGTVNLSDNDLGTSVVSLSNAKPGDTSTGCITVTYSGSLSANVHLYATVTGSLAPYVTLTVTRGTGSTSPSCATFGADGTNYIGSGNGVIWTGQLSSFPSTYAAGVVDPTDCGSAPCGAETWTNPEPHAYRFLVSLNNNNAAQGLSSNITFKWEARNL